MKSLFRRSPPSHQVGLLLASDRILLACPGSAPVFTSRAVNGPHEWARATTELFAQHGFAGTSLRQVTSQADVNIAAVNYHFGSKENLVNEVFRRRMDEMTPARLAQLENARRD
uniref:TetR/AcrR family transcriptional regulator n=1 Tax=Aeromonas taiwanensis TaxID=633417 RepID=UPI00248D5108